MPYKISDKFRLVPGIFSRLYFRFYFRFYSGNLFRFILRYFPENLSVFYLRYFPVYPVSFPDAFYSRRIVSGYIENINGKVSVESARITAKTIFRFSAVFRFRLFHGSGRHTDSGKRRERSRRDSRGIPPGFLLLLTVGFLSGNFPDIRKSFLP